MEAAKRKENINLAILGHVDAGKSTLSGNLMHLTETVDDAVMQQMESESKEVGKASFKYAWLVNKTKVERERGITINVYQNQI